MLVIVIKEQIIAPKKVCQSCVLADESGQPRWYGGKLCCGRATSKITEQQPDWYECIMGFRIANIK
ncbi:hypothetical protein [Rivularia sp. UHCC 0363]|uniref:hypothetical protein n=1 Tax=Rivularia sp. UHCC 0363 TaxID=3110244 RepID=UPI002B21DCE3|nr:hypothetical protein [Rivularia sp. UHCC 0363]MEA5598023.1 hypothetical protein [Rivularia sp. UHCC 0363]